MAQPLEPRRAAMSAMHGRVILAVDGNQARPAVEHLLTLPGVRTRRRGTGIFDHGVPRILGNWTMGRGSGGLSSLVGEQDLLEACRWLTDTAYQALAEQTQARAIVDVVGSTGVETARAIYPDALVLDQGRLAALGAGSLSELADVAQALDLPSLGASPPARGGLDELPVARGPSSPQTGSPFEDRAVFVLGAPRSGTTWLNGLLITHPDMCGHDTAESWIFRATADLWDNEALGTWIDRPLLAAAIRRFADRVFAAHRDRSNPAATWFVEKSPPHVFHLEEMAKVYPDAHYIHILRDGRDVARSMVEADLTDIDSISVCAQHWVDAVQSVRRRPARLRFREVRYEELLGDAVRGVSDLHRWLGVRVSPSTERRIAEISGLHVSKHGTTGAPGRGKWTSLDDDDLAALLAVAGPLLADLGYVRSSLRERLRGLGRGLRTRRPRA